MTSFIKASVGMNGVNNYDDLRTLLGLLSDNNFLKFNFCNWGVRDVIRALVVFQRCILISPDGVVRPGSKLDKMLRDRSGCKLSYVGYDTTSERYDALYMQPSQQCLDLIKRYETFKPYPYDDQSGKRTANYCKGATIGYGYLLSQNEFSKYTGGISENEASLLFNSKLKNYISPVQNYVKTKVTQCEFDALVMLTYNIGPRNDKKESGFYHSEVLKIINGESVEDIENAWKKYASSQGHIMQGLLNRRKAEFNVFNNNGYMKI